MQQTRPAKPPPSANCPILPFRRRPKERSRNALSSAAGPEQHRLGQVVVHAAQLLSKGFPPSVSHRGRRIEPILCPRYTYLVPRLAALGRRARGCAVAPHTGGGVGGAWVDRRWVGRTRRRRGVKCMALLLWRAAWLGQSILDMAGRCGPRFVSRAAAALWRP